jgi:hypothetical protein
VKELGFRKRIFTICVVANTLGISFGSEQGHCESYWKIIWILVWLLPNLCPASCFWARKIRTSACAKIFKIGLNKTQDSLQRTMGSHMCSKKCVTLFTMEELHISHTLKKERQVCLGVKRLLIACHPSWICALRICLTQTYCKPASVSGKMCGKNSLESGIWGIGFSTLTLCLLTHPCLHLHLYLNTKWLIPHCPWVLCITFQGDYIEADIIDRKVRVVEELFDCTT